MTASTSFRIAIPARFGSTRLPGKPLIEVAGRPLLQHVWHRALAAGACQVVIATDDERIAERAHAFGAEVCVTGTDHRSGTDRLGEVARRFDWSDDDIVVNLQGDEPLTPSVVLSQVAADLAAAPDAAVATLATPFTGDQKVEDPNLVKVVTDRDGYALYFSRAVIPFHRDPGQEAMQPCRHVGIYAYRAGFLRRFSTLDPAPIELSESLEQLRALWHGFRVHVAQAVDVPVAGVDTADDLARVAKVLGGGFDER